MIELLAEEFQKLCLSYLRSCINENGWAKSNSHFDICIFLCKHITGEEYQNKHGTLKFRIHELTSAITDRLEDLGFPVPRGYVRPTIIEEDMPRYATKLAFKLVQLIDSQDKETLLNLVWKDEDFKVLKIPGRYIKIKKNEEIKKLLDES